MKCSYDNVYDVIREVKYDVIREVDYDVISAVMTTCMTSYERRTMTS